jgi:hypothetical protein
VKALPPTTVAPGGRHDLVLVRGRDGDAGRVGPGLRSLDGVAVQAHAPAALGLDHLAAEGLGHDLVAEAHPDQRNLPLGGAQEVRQRFDPRQVVIDPRRRSGDQPGVLLARRGGQLARLDVIGGVGVAGPQQRLEHAAVAAEGRLQLDRRLPGFQQADAHQ